LCHRSLAWTTPVRSSTKAMCQRWSMVMWVSDLLWKRKESDVHVWQQDVYSQGSGQDCGSEGNKRFVFALDGPCLFKQRHWPEAGNRYESALKPRSLFTPDDAVLPCSAVTSPKLFTHTRRWSPPTQTMQISKNSPMKAHSPRHQM
jgi:hypothetical protein